MSYFRLLSLFVAGVLSANIVVTSDFMEVLSWVKEDTLVVLDIENTLIRPSHYLGSTSWGWAYVDHLKGQGYTKEQAQEETRALMKEIVQQSDYVPVQPQIPGVVNQLQTLGLEVMGLSNRPPSWGFATTDGLASVGIDLLKTAPVQGTFVMPHREDLQFIEGTLYISDMGDKGEGLIDFLEIVARRPARVLFVDDRLRNVERVHAALVRAGIECVAIHYNGAVEWKRKYDSAIAAIQLKHFGKILSNQEAEKLLAARIEK
ncbi:MAG: DUF2608 domain-containing protein [Verrucomicrobia bacterium]|nr:DUF2608 domain-containing protein [Verrucomicrobiota bacterium]